jgi:hypothetical protein
MASSFTNTDMPKIKDSLEDYYTSLFQETDKRVPALNTPYFFDTMKNIAIVNDNDFSFNKFINQCINYKIGTNNANNNDMFKILSNTAKINDIQKYINTVSVILDILEAYKKFINENANYMSTLPSLTSIKLSASDTGVNTYNFVVSTIQLELKIVSFNITNTNNIFTTTTGISSQTVTKSSHNYAPFSSGRSVLLQSKDIINNLLYFLMNITPKNAKVEVYCLYYYYKLVKCYMLLTCSCTNITINDITSTAALDNIRLITVSGISSEINVSTSSQTLLNDYTNDNKRSASELKIEYSVVLNNVSNELNQLQSSFFTNPNNSLNLLENKLNDFTINTTTSPASSKEIKLIYTSDDINNIINTEDKIKMLKNNYYIFKDNIYYKIKDLTKTDKTITIQARYATNTSPDAIELPALPSAISATTADNQTMSGCTFVNSNFVTLKKDYYDNKNKLYNINNDIKSNTIKLNGVKRNYDNNKTLDDALNTQITIVHVILGIIGLVFILLLISDVDNGIKKLVSMAFVGIILLLIIILYIMNNTKNNIEEGFNVDNIPTTDIDKIAYLNEKYTTFNAQAKLYIDVMKLNIKNVDSGDIYDDLLNIMGKEKYDKQNISNLLDHKRILGASHIDVYKYDYYNKQIYINTILVSALFIVLLYLVYNMNPKIEKNLLVFVGLILFIIIVTYYLINTNIKVHSKSSQYYWGPMDLSRT